MRIPRPFTCGTGRISVAFDTPKGRQTKTFDDPYKARRFYVKQFNAGRNPKVEKATP